MKKAIVTNFLILLVTTNSLISLAYAIDCNFTANTSTWQTPYDHVHYRLSIGKTWFMVPTAKVQAQPTSGSWAKDGSLKIYVNGSATTLYSDSDLNNSIGTHYNYSAGTGNIEFWFYTGFTSDADIQLRHLENNTGTISQNWTINVYCNTPDITVEDIWTDSSTPVVSGQTKLYAKIKNIGVVTASNINLKYYIDGSLIGQDTHSSLTSGTSQTEYFDYYNFRYSGIHSYKVVVESVYGETNTSNNERTETVSVIERPNISPSTCNLGIDQEGNRINISWKSECFPNSYYILIKVQEENYNTSNNGYFSLTYNNLSGLSSIQI